VRFEKYWALVGLGDIKKQQGDLAGALKSYQEGLAIFDRLARADPDNADRQGDLWVIVGRVASAYRDSGDNSKALNFYRQGRAILSRLTKLSPDNAEWKQDLARFDRLIAALAPSRLEHGRNPRNPPSRR
jgi:tetratricopeptide (TPR) repeat protein